MRNRPLLSKDDQLIHVTYLHAFLSCCFSDEQNLKPDTHVATSSNFKNSNKNDDENEWFTIDEELIDPNSENSSKCGKYFPSRS